jgi:hypothetical protein
VAQGATVRVEASGLPAGAQVEVWLHSTPQRLATVTADGDGRIAVTVRVPASTPAGAHTIEVVAGAASGTAALQVTAFALGATGVAVGGALAAAVAALLAGAALLGGRRRRVLG